MYGDVGLGPLVFLGAQGLSNLVLLWTYVSGLIPNHHLCIMLMLSQMHVQL